MKNLKIFKGKECKNKRGFTLIELVMTIVLTGILSVGLYEAMILGINDYIMNEHYLHSNNSMTYAISVLRRNLVNAVMPPSIISPSTSAYCPLSKSINPKTSANTPIVRANLSKQTTTCGGASGPACNEIAFYQNINAASRGTVTQLVVFCVYNKILYEEVTNDAGQTTPYPVANNIRILIFSLGSVLSGYSLPSAPLPIPTSSPSVCQKNKTTGIYSCNINFVITNSVGYSQIGGVSVIVAN
ncbi:PilW family protein [Candidatus Acidulodesulfobacterium sp. H_13]